MPSNIGCLLAQANCNYVTQEFENLISTSLVFAHTTWLKCTFASSERLAHMMCRERDIVGFAYATYGQLELGSSKHLPEVSVISRDARIGIDSLDEHNS